MIHASRRRPFSSGPTFTIAFVSSPTMPCEERWTDDGYVLVLRRLDAGRVELWDPQTQRVDSVHASYEDAVNDLREDEYTQLFEGP